MRYVDETLNKHLPNSVTVLPVRISFFEGGGEAESAGTEQGRVFLNYQDSESFGSAWSLITLTAALFFKSGYNLNGEFGISD